MGKIACAYCGTANDDAHRFCMHCGRAIESAGAESPSDRGPPEDAASGEGEPVGSSSDGGTPTRVVETEPCPTCGYRNLPEAAACHRCGEPLRARRTDPGVVADHEAATGPAPSPPSGPGPRESRPGTQLFVSRPVQDEGRLVHLLADGESEVHDVGEESTIGRIEGDVREPEDPYLSARHARIRRRGSGFVLEDLDSTNGTFVRIDGEVELQPGDQILIGGQILEFVV